MSLACPDLYKLIFQTFYHTYFPHKKISEILPLYSGIIVVLSKK